MSREVCKVVHSLSKLARLLGTTVGMEFNDRELGARAKLAEAEQG